MHALQINKHSSDEIELEVEPARDRFAGKILDESFAACALILRFRNDVLTGVACHCFTMSHRRRFPIKLAFHAQSYGDSALNLR